MVVLYLKAESKKRGRLWVVGSIDDDGTFEAIRVLEPLKDDRGLCLVLSSKDEEDRGIDLGKLSKGFAGAARREKEKWDEAVRACSAH